MDVMACNTLKCKDDFLDNGRFSQFTGTYQTHEHNAYAKNKSGQATKFSNYNNTKPTVLRNLSLVLRPANFELNINLSHDAKSIDTPNL